MIEQDFNLVSKEAFKRMPPSCQRQFSLPTFFVYHTQQTSFVSSYARTPGQQSCNATVKDIISDDYCWAVLRQRIKSAKLVTNLGVQDVLMDYILMHAEELEQMKQGRLQSQNQSHCNPDTTTQKTKRRVPCIIGLKETERTNTVGPLSSSRLYHINENECQLRA
eukprot:5953613-Ditylum_brightwellii.AAC.1